MSGYDALDELYERLREAEDAQHARRAGEITPETIRAARGGVADGYGRECHVVCENAADGDSEPLVDISRDTRERIEADAWEAARLDMSLTWEERRDAIVALLDRQAALTERCGWEAAEACSRAIALCHERDARIVELRKKVNALAVERDELRAELDAHDGTCDSWERICADLRAMDVGNLIALGNGNYVEDTRHDEMAARIERMAKQ